MHSLTELRHDINDSHGRKVRGCGLTLLLRYLTFKYSSFVYTKSYNLPLSGTKGIWCTIVQVQDTALLRAYLFSPIFPIYATVVVRRDIGAPFCVYEVAPDLRMYQSVDPAVLLGGSRCRVRRRLSHDIAFTMKATSCSSRRTRRRKFPRRNKDTDIIGIPGLYPSIDYVDRMQALRTISSSGVR